MFGGNCSLCGQWDPGAAAQRCGYPGAAQGHGWGSGELCPQQELEPDDPEGFSQPKSCWGFTEAPPPPPAHLHTPSSRWAEGKLCEKHSSSHSDLTPPFLPSLLGDSSSTLHCLHRLISCMGPGCRRPCWGCSVLLMLHWMAAESGSEPAPPRVSAVLNLSCETALGKSLIGWWLAKGQPKMLRHAALLQWCSKKIIKKAQAGLRPEKQPHKKKQLKLLLSSFRPK